MSLNISISGDMDVLAELRSGYQIHLFGVPEIVSGSASSFPAKGFALVAALILAPGRKMTRQAAATLLWEDVDQTRALANLRQLLVRLHRSQPDKHALVEAVGSTLSVGEGSLSSDIAFFLEAYQAIDLSIRKKAILAMRGSLLDGIEAGSDQFYLWLLAERVRLKELFFATATGVLNDISRYGAATVTEIAAIAERLIAFDPEREESYRLVMETYARCGDSNAGTRVFNSLCEMLRVDSANKDPSPITTALMKRIESQSRACAVHAETDLSVRKAPRVAFALPLKADGSLVMPLTRAFVDDVANSLARFRSFAVLAPHSSFAVRQDQEFSKALGTSIQYVVRSVVLHDNFVSVSLHHEATLEIIWAAEFKLDAGNLQTVFQIVSKQVAGSLAEALERYHHDPIRNTDPGSYIHLLNGQNLLRQCDLSFVRRARREFRRAADLDPLLAAPRARIAQTLQLEWLLLGGADPYLLQRARAEAEAAVEIDASAGMGHWMAAVISLYQRDYEGSAQKFAEAESLCPNSADLLLQHADALAHFGDAEKAWVKFEMAIDLNPLAPDIYWWAGAGIAFHRHDYAKAVELCGNMENDEPALRVLTASHALQDNLPAAHSCAARLVENFPGMSAREIVRLSPDKNAAVNDEFYRGLRLAGIK